MRTGPNHVLRTVTQHRKRVGRPENTDVRVREHLTPGEVEALAAAAKKRGRYGHRDALVIRQNHAYVLRLTRTDTVEELDVTPGAGIADVVEVRGPLAEGDRLVIRGGERLAAGQAVRVIDRAHRAPATIHPG